MCHVCVWFTLCVPRCRLWRTGPARCQWNRETAAPPPSIPLTTLSSPPRLPWRRWMNAGPACWRKDSESNRNTRLVDELPLFFFGFLIYFPHCSYILLELVETERNYVRDLGLVVEVSWNFTALLPKSADLNVSWFSLSSLYYKTNIFV